jgi:hypothetical protein
MTASELMMEHQQKPPVTCLLPHEDVRKFLLELIAQSNFPGAMSEFVSGVKGQLTSAEIYQGR